MSIIAGGVFAAGAFNNGMFSEAAGTPITSLSQWLRMGPDPLGRPYNGLFAYISQTDYYVPGGQSKYRSEIRTLFSLMPWCRSYCYHWRFVVPQDWQNLGPAAPVIVLQAHEVNGASVGRRPTFAGEIENGNLNFVFSRDSIPSGSAAASIPIAAGTEYEITMRATWADGTNAPDSDGSIDIYLGDQRIGGWSGRNTWAGTPITEPNPPYLKCGVYQAGPGSSWWNGKAAKIFYSAAMVTTGDETPASLRAYVDAQLGRFGNTPLNLPI